MGNEAQKNVSVTDSLSAMIPPSGKRGEEQNEQRSLASHLHVSFLLPRQSSFMYLKLSAYSPNPSGVFGCSAAVSRAHFRISSVGSQSPS